MKSVSSGLWVCLLLVLTWCLLCGAALADGGSTDKQLDALETRFFEHNYDSDAVDDRLTRLEKMVFGEQRSGDEQKRLSDLQAAVKDADANNPNPAGDTSQTSQPAGDSSQTSQPVGDTSQFNQPAAGGDSSTGQPADATPAPTQQAGNSAGGGQDTAPGDVSDSSDYPRITALENAILGHSEKEMPVTRRLDQLELKAFGKPSSDTDLSARTDKLENYVRTKLHMPNFNQVDQPPSYQYQSSAPPGQYGGGTPYGYPGVPAQGGAPSPSVTTNEPPPNAPLGDKLTWMEQTVFGQANPQDTPSNRANRLEQALFPQDSSNAHAPLQEQINMLVGAVELLQSERQGGAIPGAPQFPPAGATGYGAPSQYQYPGNVATNSMSAQPGAYGDPNQAYNQYNNQYNSQYNNQTQQQPNQQQQQQQKKGHPFLKSLAHVLGAVGSMAAGAMSSGMMYGGMGGFGGYGYGGMPGMGYMPGYAW